MPGAAKGPIWTAGFMSGTSIDAVDGALILTDGERVYDYGPAIERPYTDAERTVVAAAVQAARDWAWRGPEPIAAFRIAEAILTDLHAEAFQRLCEAAGPARAPALAGVHGQTVLHRRPTRKRRGATRQILDAAGLAAAIGVPLVSDFRSADVAAGGEGAPLAPAYHAALLSEDKGRPAAVLNLGGVANVTFKTAEGGLVAFDTGPANGPVDEWVEGHGRGRFDVDGALAAAGRVHQGLLDQLLDHPYFDEAPPKSLDRYDFSASLARGLSVEDGAATLTALSARAVGIGLDLLPAYPERVVVCGGGRRNPTLMAMLRESLRCRVDSAEEAGWRGDSIEAEAFAFLAARHVRGMPISWPGTTGAPEPLAGGRLSAP